jgi:uncharacterized protein (TIGR03435 family)
LEFEVASVKPSPPPDRRGRIVGCRGGPGAQSPENGFPRGSPDLFTCESVTLADLLIMAYQLEYYQFSIPDWMKDRGLAFDLNARVPEGATKDQLDLMIQNLLADRFKMVVHRESREIQQYNLVVAKNGPKFKESPPLTPKPDPADGCFRNPRAAACLDTKKGPGGPLKLGDDGYPVLQGRMTGAFVQGRARIHYPDTTMTLFASYLSLQLRKPVTDATGLKGKYDIAMFWATDDAARASPDPGGVLVAADPAPTLMEALQDQLGLRLESKKGPVEFVVVDHAEKIPTEN